MEMDKVSKALNAFTVGFYECKWMPFGIMNALATFQQLMETCLGNLQLQLYIIYLNDIIIDFVATHKEHLQCLQAVFKGLRSARLKLNCSKCEFFKMEVSYLEHVVP